jgi:ThiF family protein
MKIKCRIRIARDQYDLLYKHLFPGDNDEHGAVLLAGMSNASGRMSLHVREVHLAVDGVDYVAGKIGYRALTPKFIHRIITRARDERLVYLAVHNHFGDREVAFSSTDLDSHELGYPALLQISRGMPVGALVLARHAVSADIWMSKTARLEIEDAIVVGSALERLTPSPKKDLPAAAQTYDRQRRMFGKLGQRELADCHVAILGLGGIGSLVAEYLAHLGVGHFTLVDSDVVEDSNLSRIVGATAADAHKRIAKVKVARRLIRAVHPKAQVVTIVGDIARELIAKQIVGCDYLFLAADSMRARLVVNAIVHQYLIPAVQLGSKIRIDEQGGLLEIMSANRPLRPGHLCLWCNQLIDPVALAREAKTDAERKAQAYGVEEPNPSVITLNAVSAAHAVSDFLLDYLALRREAAPLHYEHFHFLDRRRSLVEPRQDRTCPECSVEGLRFGRGDAVTLPCMEG